jgi:ElaB/YqjD/DUF883 family membrane-anchored ribosome-binding protein
MNVATLLKRSANFFMIARVVKLVMGDLVAEACSDAGAVKKRVSTMLGAAPYQAAGAAGALGFMLGVSLAKRRHNRKF